MRQCAAFVMGEEPEQGFLTGNESRSPKHETVALKCHRHPNCMHRNNLSLCAFMLGMVVTAFIVGATLLASSARLASLHGSVAFEEKEERVLNGESSPSCSNSGDDTEYHTRTSLARIANMYSEDMCCAACAGDPECKAWTWEKKRFVSGLSNYCFLKKLEPDEVPTVVKRPDVVSGVLEHRLQKHGFVAKAISSSVQFTMSVGSPLDSNETCRGAIDVQGLGRLWVVNAKWFTPRLAANRIDVPVNDGAVIPHMRSRAFLSDSCGDGEHKRSDLANIRFLGRTIRYSIDLRGAGCGCNAQLHLVPMKRSERNKSRCHDFFCGPAQSHICGETCAVIRLQDANRFSWSTSLHLGDDPIGVSVGYGGGQRRNGRREWSQFDYGPGSKCIDTSWPFDVQISFPTDDQGVLAAVEVILSQSGRSCNLTTRIEKYRWQNRNAMVSLSSMLDKGLTPVISYWSSPHMEWLDGLGKDGQGPCMQDVPQRCAESMRFQHLSVLWYQSKLAYTPLFDVALASIHEKSFQQDATKRTIVPQPSAPRAKAGDGQTEVTTDNVEWEVVFSIVPVRKAPYFKARVLRHKRKGQVLIGERAGNWIRLLREPGWVAIKKEERKTSIFLVERLVVYKKLGRGSCEEAGMFPIEDMETCQAAAFALGYLDTFPNVYHGVSSKPYGCYVMKAQLFFVSNPENKRNGVGHRDCICTSRAYPTTTITTTTEASTRKASDANRDAALVGHALPTTTITSTTGENMEELNLEGAQINSQTLPADRPTMQSPFLHGFPKSVATSTMRENVENDNLQGTWSNSRWQSPSSTPVMTTATRARTTSMKTSVAPANQLLG